MDQSWFDTIYAWIPAIPVVALVLLFIATKLLPKNKTPGGFVAPAQKAVTAIAGAIIIITLAFILVILLIASGSNGR